MIRDSGGLRQWNGKIGSGSGSGAAARMRQRRRQGRSLT
ncbi:hypothetical protein BSLA_03f0449 [Burkholderia stabilis]|nr:hypothetical protein BSLA_03f0449 [Burkholderia stabilis]